ncbi:outer membrane beta-barrel family protein [Niabella hibiscisoli]|uniref:outer membrane beta-barrel family protein n=1 Tax=Niabella hibiscisoli TaxID=1825928 RepID=UPI001F10A871|nr:outer membrane beta-barrel family protein [Niabella hibiscisoli]MCH5717316.1 TonB-dependent receptor [Niabella hibiscisoli]
MQDAAKPFKCYFITFNGRFIPFTVKCFASDGAEDSFAAQTNFMRSLFLSLFFTGVVCFANAQTVTGKITDADTRPMPNVSVSLLKAADSTLVKMNLTDKDGKYQFEKAEEGKYLVMATNVGYVPMYSPLINLNTGKDTKQDIVLEKASTQMAGVVVTAKRPMVEVKAGKTIVNVDASPTNAGLNVLEILEKSPGVSVDNDGNISVKGKGGVLVLIDDKPTYMSSTQLATFLRSLQASGLDKIEIMTNPPAKYDAAGNSGIINIKTKKGTIKGINGNANLNYANGFYSRYNGGLNLNYRNNKVNLFGSYNGGHWANKSTLTLDRKFLAEDNSTLKGSSDQVSERSNGGDYHNAKIGMDYYFNNKNVAGVVVNGNFGNWKETQNSNSNLRDASGDIESRIKSLAINKTNSNNISTNLNYKHTFDSAGHELSVDFDQAYYKNQGSTYLLTKPLNAAGQQSFIDIFLLGDIPSEINIYSGKIDYVKSLSKFLKVEAGLKSSFVNTDNRVMYTRKDSMDWMNDAKRSNHFIYKENINAAYAIFSSTLKKWELTAGLRVENTVAKGHQMQNDSSFSRNYTNLFPNAGVTFNASETHQLSLSYSRRITRPDYDDLNPFVFFLDSLTYGQGNPYLQPQFTNNIELSHTFKRVLTTTINYTQTNDIIAEMLKQDTENKITFQTKENFSKMKQLGLAVSLNMPVVKWWTLNLYANVFNNHYTGIYSNGKRNDPVDIQLTGFTGNMSNTFTYGKGWSSEISGWYGTRFMEGLMVSGQMGALNAALAKEVLKKKGTVKLGVRDIFRTQIFNGYAKYSDVDVDIQNKRDSRQFTLTFNYRFGNNKVAPTRRRTGGAGDEQNRVKSGGN